MEIRVLSDLHFEFHRDGGKSFIASLNLQKEDVLALVGDIATIKCLESVLQQICPRVTQVLFVCGNHEYYGSNPKKVDQILLSVSSTHKNFIRLEKDIFLLPSGQRVLGTTLWFPESVPARALAPLWSDFHAIRRLEDWVYEENDKSVQFLNQELQKGDIVLTHYLPSWKSVHPMYAGERTNCYFVCDLEPLIVERAPALWLHGHTHTSHNYKIGSTRVVCNPFGYAKIDLNTKFNEHLTVTM